MIAMPLLSLACVAVAIVDPTANYDSIGYHMIAIFHAGADELHFAAGFGVAFPSFQIDVGLDASDVVNAASISAVIAF